MSGKDTAAPLGHSTNLIGIPTGLLASSVFNDHPVALHISGVRESNQSLFARLQAAGDAAASAEIFQDYMCVLFGLAPDQIGTQRPDGRHRFRSSYLKLLQGWGFDANNPQGAVLKGWVESRFGLFPNFHKEPITRIYSHAWMTYVEEKMCSRFHNNSINTQLDLLYEFCQWTLSRLRSTTRRHITLYRGENISHSVRSLPTDSEGRVTHSFNNLVSFTSSRETACEFGDIIVEAEIPTVKILFFNDLLPCHPLKGEGEYLVIGGSYRIKASYY